MVESKPIFKEFSISNIESYMGVCMVNNQYNSYVSYSLLITGIIYKEFLRYFKNDFNLTI